MGNSCDGIILIDKKEGETSFDATRRVGKILKVRKVGHAGTLDPFATGLLIVLLGQGTKLFPYLVKLNKEYTGTMRLGFETDTQDVDGRVLNVREVPEYRLEALRDKARGFIGEIEQVPPSFSAVRHKGKRAYEYARRGIEVALGPRKVRIHSLDVLSMDLPDVTIRVVCSGGTYVRALVSDFGRALGPGAHLISLRRTASGPFDVKNAVTINEAGGEPLKSFLGERMIPLGWALPHLKGVEIDNSMAHRIRNGYQPRARDLMPSGNASKTPAAEIRLLKGEELVAIARVPHEGAQTERRVKILRVFR